MRFSERLKKIPPYLFVEIDRKIEEKKSQGVDVISFGVGDPDMPSPEKVIATLCRESKNPLNHRYPSYFGLPEFRSAASEWIEKRFSVHLDPEREILPLLGSKEGIAHFALAVLDPGDVALICEPGYPVYEIGALLAGAEPFSLPLTRENEFLPDLDSIPGEILKRSKILWLNYPNNPTGAVANREFFEMAVRFAQENDIILAHDNAYSEITYDGFIAPSVMEIEGARNVAIEFHSLSKSFNMTGWRIGFAIGNERIIESLASIKTNVDSGIFNPIQLAGITALLEEAETIQRMRNVYAKRREFLVREFLELGWNVTPPKGSIYIWLPVPRGFDSISFSKDVLDRAGVFFTPGNVYGPSGEGYVRVSLTVPDERIELAIERLKEAFK